MKIRALFPFLQEQRCGDGAGACSFSDRMPCTATSALVALALSMRVYCCEVL